MEDHSIWTIFIFNYKAGMKMKKSHIAFIKHEICNQILNERMFEKMKRTKLIRKYYHQGKVKKIS